MWFDLGSNAVRILPGPIRMYLECNTKTLQMHIKLLQNKHVKSRFFVIYNAWGSFKKRNALH